jgi:hypothetical protein
LRDVAQTIIAVRAKIRRPNQFKNISHVQPGGSSALVAAVVALVAVVALAAAA